MLEKSPIHATPLRGTQDSLCVLVKQASLDGEIVIRHMHRRFEITREVSQTAFFAAPMRQFRPAHEIEQQRSR